MPLSALLRFLHAAPGEGVSDAELLQRFAAVRDEAAFELLVRRHADLVWKVCRGVLRQEADAEDAFQATFLALARKAGSIRGVSVAGWLHRVALHAALKLRAKGARSAVVDLPDVPAPTGADPDLVAAVHEELSQLGERYRLPVLLCELEAHTHAEAAKVLGWPVGTVSGRLSRGRDRLRQRLERRGVALGLIAITRSASGNLVRSAVSAVGGSATPAVVSLAEGALSAMRTAKLKVMAAVSITAMGLIGTGTIVAVGQEKKPAEGGKSAPAAKAEVGKPDPVWNEKDKVPSAFPEIKPIPWPEIKTFVSSRVPTVLESDTLLQKLQKAKIKAAIEGIVVEVTVWEMGASDPKKADPEGQRSRIEALVEDAATASLDLHERREDRDEWLRFRVGVQKQLEMIAEDRVRSGIAVVSSMSIAHQRRLDAEIALLKHIEASKPRAK